VSARCLLAIPPLVKYAAGPLLGPAMLRGAAEDAGHVVEVLDLSVRWIRDFTRDADLDTPSMDTPFLGDHSKPPTLLNEAQDAFVRVLERAVPVASDERTDRSTALTLPLSHEEVAWAVDLLVIGDLGTWLRDQLDGVTRPDLVGMSLLYSGQVLAALALARIVEQWWPGCSVVFGGPHVTALQQTISRDAGYAREAVDGFVFGHAERTFVELLGAVERGTAWPAEVVRPGCGEVVLAQEDMGGIPRFGELAEYGLPRLVLPVQLSRGCPYARCRFCTYGPIGGEYRRLSGEAFENTVDLAEEQGAAIAFKDSLLTPGQLRRVARVIRGRVAWSACTKLHPGHDRALAQELVASGCETLEFGLETLVPDTQLLIDKRQAPELFKRVLADMVTEGLTVVVNVMAGFPHADAGEEKRWLAFVEERVEASSETAPVRLECNRFELERLAPLARQPERQPERFGIAVTRMWPWASVVGWVEARRPTRTA
jgi:hypothetical protein